MKFDRFHWNLFGQKEHVRNLSKMYMALNNTKIILNIVINTKIKCMVNCHFVLFKIFKCVLCIQNC